VSNVSEPLASPDARVPPRLDVHRYAHAADLATGALLLLALWLEVVGIERHLIAGRAFDPPSPSFVLYLSASLQIVRHVLWPKPTAWSRFQSVRERVMRRAYVGDAVRAFVATRLAVFLVAFFSVLTIGLSAKPGFILSREPLYNLPARFDAGWYGDIALDGYTWDHTFQRQRNIAFFPALPMLMRPVGVLFGMNDRTVPRERRMLRALWAGTVLSLVAFLWALYYVARVTADLVGAEYADSATLLLAAYPFALFYNVPYTESLFLLGAAGASHHFLRKEWISASCFGLLAGLTRPNGCFVSVPLGILALQQIYQMWSRPSESASGAPHPGRATLVRLLVAAMPGIGMLIFTVFLFKLTGVWFAWARSHEAWGRTYQGLGPLMTAFGWLRDEPFLQVVGNIPFNTLNTLGLIFALALTYPVFRRVGIAWGVFVLVNVVPPLFAGGVLSMGRLSATLFPLFLALATVVPRRNVPAWVAGFAVGQGLCAALFFTWRELF
jgi:Mannosyltransferase (PIG-V)